MRNAYIMRLQGSRIRNLLIAMLLSGAVSACANVSSDTSSGIGHVPPSPSVQSNPGDIFNMNGNMIY